MTHADPRLTIRDILEDNWVIDEVPKFSTAWYDRKLEEPQVVVSEISVVPEYIGFSDSLETSLRRFRGQYAVDVWTTDKDLKFRMVHSIDDILHAKCNNPGDKLEFMESSGWVPMDEPSVHPRLFRSRMRIEVLYYG